MLKSIVTFILMLFFLGTINAQVEVAEVSHSRLSSLKKKKTIFVCRDTDDAEALEKSFREVWKINKIYVTPISKLKPLDFKNSLIFSIGGNSRTNGSTTNSWTYLRLADGKEALARVDLHISFVDYEKVFTWEDDAVAYLYKEGSLKNWQPNILRSYLKLINNKMKEGEKRRLYSNVVDKKEIVQLKKETLYILDYAFVKFGAFTGDETKRHNPKKILKKYPYKYEVISAADLDEKIKNSKDPIYYLVYLKSSANKYVTIFNSKTGNMVYSKFKNVSYNIKSKDFSALARAIK